VVQRPLTDLLRAAEEAIPLPPVEEEIDEGEARVAVEVTVAIDLQVVVGVLGLRLLVEGRGPEAEVTVGLAVDRHREEVMCR
jgi:hypothetical protein